MKIAVMGAGGLGGYFGARLAAAGHEVAFIARGRHLAAMRERGLQLRSALGPLHLHPVRATDQPAEVGPVDMVLVAVKLWDTASAAEAIAPLIGPQTAVVSFQNGVDKDDVLTRALGPAHVMGGICYIAAVIGDPGEIVHTGTLQKLVFGELDGSGSGRSQRFLEACRGAGIDAELSGDIRRQTWEKFVFLVGLSGTTSTVRLPIGAVRGEPASRALLHAVMAETVAVGRAAGVALAADFADDRLKFCDTLPAVMTSSMHGDLRRGNRLELPWLSGAVVAMGQRLAVPTPCNLVISQVLASYVLGAPEAAA